MLIYKITNNINGKIYIGLYTKGLQLFKNYWGSGVIISKAILKYGKENFTKEILEDNITSKEDLFNKEKFYILKYNSTHPTIGYNISEGGQGNFSKHKESTKKLIATKAKIRFSKASSHPRNGVTLSEEIKDKIKKSNESNHLRKVIKCQEQFTSILIQLALNNFTKKDMLRFCYKPGSFSKKILTDLYRDIFLKVNKFSLISHKKSEDPIKKSILKKSLTGSNKWTETRKQKASLRFSGENNPVYGIRFQWMYRNKINKRVDLNEVEKHLENGWTKGRFK